ncbi:unnamed protein product [Bursaphelenchus xylophilus]|uniref:(pine wood nematode) hypothetical protein n=1 Tax=Bursaphelenchus xylophilus TaxID=6326 RepID=A0A1I7SQV4_BURXY|nr:unnamed protein product [Bursaphelenchus xylophilus]CAG9110444.1 unnamed protein product [Bursaphelenchus xylophilus]
MTIMGAYLRDFHVTYDHCIGLLSIITNSLLLYLAIKKSDNYMKKYSIILVMSSVVDLFYNSMSIIFTPIVEIQQGSMFFFLGGVFEKLPHQPMGVIWMIFLFSIFATIINIPMQFVYRYTALCLNRQLTITKYIALYLVILPILAAHCVWGYYVFYPHEDVIASHLPILKADPVWSPNTPNFFVGDQHYFPAAMHFSVSFLIVAISYLIVIVVGLKIYLQLRKVRFCMSKGTLEAQNQLTKILLIQAIIPFLSLSGPVMAVTAASLFSVEVPLLGYVMTYTAMWLPVVNSVSAILIIPNYRRSLFCRPSRKVLFSSTFFSISRQNASTA